MGTVVSTFRGHYIVNAPDPLKKEVCIVGLKTGNIYNYSEDTLVNVCHDSELITGAPE